MTSDEAFEFLRQEANQELKTVQEQGADYMNRGNLVQARRALDRAEQIKVMVTSLQELQERWKSLVLPVVEGPTPEPNGRHRGAFGHLSAGKKNTSDRILHSPFTGPGGNGRKW